jgi:Ca2+-binding RTX toxin-like protein
VLADVNEPGHIDYRGLPGEQNDVTLTRFAGGVYSVTDTVGVVAGVGCVQQTPTTAVCVVGDDESSADIQLGDGDDRLSYGGVSPDDGAKISDGPGNDVVSGSARDDIFINGPGNDVLIGGAGEDDLLGGPGSDRLVGGAARDTVRYDDRHGAVRADLQGDADDGASGEHDQIASDVENLVGGRGNDRLTGNSHNNQLDGLAGKDRLQGRSGADEIDGGPGNDRIVGGPGRDFLSGADGRDRIDARDGRRDDIRCGFYLRRGDVAIVDRLDHVFRCAVVRRP